MYAIPWFVTYLANKFPNVEVLLDFWEYVVCVDEPCFIFYFLVAMVHYHQGKIFGSESAKLPETMTKLNVMGARDLEEIILTARKLQANTPYSFENLPEVNVIFTKNHFGLQSACQRLESL